MSCRLFLAIAFCLSGCATLLQQNKRARYVKEVEMSVSTIRAIVLSQIPVGYKSISSNGREIVSKLFAPTSDGFHDGEDATDRFYVQYTILGDRRPYDVEVIVIHEKRVLRG